MFKVILTPENQRGQDWDGLRVIVWSKTVLLKGPREYLGRRVKPPENIVGLRREIRKFNMQMQEDKDRIEAKKRKNEARMARRGLRGEEKIEVDEYGHELKRVVSRAERELVV